MRRISGYVDHVRFRNEDNGYTVLSLDMDGDEETVVGVFQFLHEGEYMELEGEYVEHPVHGPQFQMTSYEVTMPDDIQSMERYLGSGAIKGVARRSPRESSKSLRWTRSALSRRNRRGLRR